MGLFNWLSSRVGNDLDEQVHGPAGVAQVGFDIVSAEAPIVIHAQILDLHEAEISFVAVADTQQGSEPLKHDQHTTEGSLTVDLGKAELWRGGTLTIAARVNRKGLHNELAVLVVEVKQPAQPASSAAPVAFQTYSVEARFNDAGKAQLELVVRIASST